MYQNQLALAILKKVAELLWPPPKFQVNINIQLNTARVSRLSFCFLWLWLNTVYRSYIHITPTRKCCVFINQREANLYCILHKCSYSYAQRWNRGKERLVSEFSLAGQKQNLKKLRVISRTRSVFSTVSFRKLVVPLSVLSLNQDIKIWLIMLCNFDM